MGAADVQDEQREEERRGGDGQERTERVQNYGQSSRECRRWRRRSSVVQCCDKGEEGLGYMSTTGQDIGGAGGG